MNEGASAAATERASRGAVWSHGATDEGIQGRQAHNVGVEENGRRAESAQHPGEGGAKHVQRRVSTMMETENGPVHMAPPFMLHRSLRYRLSRWPGGGRQQHVQRTLTRLQTELALERKGPTVGPPDCHY